MLPLACLITLACLIVTARAFGQPMPPVIRVEKADPAHARLVDCWLQVENWDGHSVGRQGERGYFQFKRATWAQFSEYDFHTAGLRGPGPFDVQKQTAARFVSAIAHLLEVYGLPRTVYNFALGWRAGVENLRLGHVTAEERDYAMRVVNLYYDETGK